VLRTPALAALATLAALTAAVHTRARAAPTGAPGPRTPGGPGTLADPPGEGDPDAAAAAERAAAAVLERHCRPCHTGPESSGGFDVLDLSGLRAQGLIAPGDAAGSPLAQRMVAGEMPPEPVAVRPSPAELAAVRAWIDGMTEATPLRRDAETDRALAADLAALLPGDRPYARWLTLVPVANAGAPEAQLARYRAALGVMLASLSWSPVARPPTAIDPQRTLYRIDLRDLGWTAATWDALRAAHPYGAARPAGVPEALRVDWLVATASRPPLYHQILGLPDRDADLARRLGVDVAGDLAAGTAARAGFTSSGVSTSNRVIERHATRHGALWRSFDFRSSRGREDVFAHPLDFVPAGGEIIFNLPNGLQGYMLVDGAGRRIDKAPTAIVSDPRRPDRAVENGVSCIGCHHAGIIPRADQLRAAAEALPYHERARLEALHPPAEDLARLYAADRARFAAAWAAATGGAPVATDPASEPVTLLVARYEAELDLRRAAAELGLGPDELERRLARSPDLRRALTGLTVRGGRIKREVWEQRFPRALVELGVGVPAGAAAAYDAAYAGYAGAPAAYAGAPAGSIRSVGSAGSAGSVGSVGSVWIDGRRRSWIRLPGALDQAAALAACRARGLELPRPAELAAAVSAGLAAGLGAVAPLWTAGARLDAANQRYAAVVDPFSGAARRADPADRHAAVCAQL
jgi:hypothetical protein